MAYSSQSSSQAYWQPNDQPNHIQIANATVYKNTIKNFSANPNMRITFTVGIGYEDQITSAQSVIRGVLEGHDAVLKDPEPLVLVDQLGASTINLKVYFWIDSSTRSTLKLKSSVIRLSVRALTAAGISMPDESREVIFPQGVPVRMLDGTVERSHAPSTQQPIAPVVIPPEGEECSSIAVEAEGDLTTETQDLNRQADESRDPEGGANVLGPVDAGGYRGIPCRGGTVALRKKTASRRWPAC